jgi:hypothetical protein
MTETGAPTDLTGGMPATAASIDSVARAMWKSSIRRQFSDIR